MPVLSGAACDIPDSICRIRGTNLLFVKKYCFLKKYIDFFCEIVYNENIRYLFGQDVPCGKEEIPQKGRYFICSSKRS